MNEYFIIGMDFFKDKKLKGQSAIFNSYKFRIFPFKFQGKKYFPNIVPENLIDQWRPKEKGKYRYKFTTPQAQKISKVTSLEHSLIETIKYGSKIFTEPDLKKKSKLPVKPMIYAYALDNILVAMKGKRIFERFGFNLPKQTSKKYTSKLVVNFETWVFPSDASDWINPETGESLTGYLQPIELSYLLNECVNIEHY